MPAARNEISTIRNRAGSIMAAVAYAFTGAAPVALRRRVMSACLSFATEAVGSGSGIDRISFSSLTALTAVFCFPVVGPTDRAFERHYECWPLQAKLLAMVQGRLAQHSFSFRR